MKFYAVIGDIVSSRHISDREETQQFLNQTLEDINQTYQEVIVSNFTITLGDEFQGLLKSGEHLLEIVDRIRFALDPIAVRFGIGVGTMATSIKKEVSIGADGPAYWHARDAIKAVHEIADVAKCRIAVSVGYSSTVIDLVNETLQLSDYIESKWVTSQRAFVRKRLLETGYDLTVPQVEMARIDKSTPQKVNAKIKSTGYYQFISTRLAIEKTLTEFELEG